MPRSTPARMARSLVILLTTALLLAGCGIAPAGMPVTTQTPPPASTSLPTREPTATNLPPTTAPEPSPTTTPTPIQPVIWFSPALPAAVRQGMQLPGNVRVTADRGKANLFLEIGQAGKSPLSWQWVYALAAPFPTAMDGLAWADLLAGWRDGPTRLYGGKPLLVTAETRKVLEAVFGPAAPSSLHVVDEEILLQTAWEEEDTLAVIPFEAIEPRWKVLRVDGISPLDRDFTTYPLSVRLALTGDAQALKTAGEIPIPTNRDPGKLTILSMTGVTAISRQVAERMESKGLTYPASQIRPWLADADLAHISNEVSFYQDCPKAGPERRDMRFCSRPEYIQLLEHVGTDIVELTGNHNLDWGPQPYLDTLAMYGERGWKTYGGGANLEEALKPLLIEHHGNRLAFLGCSMAGPQDVWATDLTPGSAPCDLNKLEQTVRQLREQGYLPVVTFQHVETDGYVPAVAQGKPDFRRLAAAGAVIVSGSQSHYAQTMTFVNDSFIHYGLGNLFFDQMQPEEIRPAFIDRHVFFDGRYLGVELLTSKLEDYALQRPMTGTERQDFLNKIFSLCDWNEE